MYTIKEMIHENETMKVYGFMVYRKDGRSMPKGMITSFNAYHEEPLSNVFKGRTQIEFAVQSPTGDASDHFHYTMPCLDFTQAKAIVDKYREGVEAMMNEHKKQELYS